MDSKNQLATFSLCIVVGFCGGILYEFFALFRCFFGCTHGKNQFLGGILDFLFFICYAVFCIISSFLLHFSGFRAYMWLGFGLGGGLYLKILRRILAFWENMCYNFVHKRLFKSQKQEKNSLNRGKDI